MSRKTQRYSKEFKAEAVRTVLENQLSISEGASRLSLPEGTLGQWVTAARKGLGTPGSRTVAELESEILQLRKALNEARLERDILKKATAYFAQESLKNTRYWVKQLIRNNDSHFYDLFVSTGKERRIKPELTTLLNNLLHSAEFQALQDKYLTGEYGVVHSGPFMSVYEKVLGGKSRKRCAISRKLISPGEVVYKYRHVDTVEYIAAKA